MASGSGDMPELAKCRNVSLLLDALELRGDDEEVRRVFLQPSRERMEMLRWVLISTDPSGASNDYLNLPTEEDELCQCLVNALMQLNCLPEDKYEEFVRGTYDSEEQLQLWILLLKTAEWAQVNH